MTDTTDMISMPREVFEEIVEKAAEMGARRALGLVSLGDPNAAEDIREARNLLAMYRVVRTGILKQVGQIIALVVFGALLVMLGQRYLPGLPAGGR